MSDAISRPGWHLVPLPHGFRLHLCVSEESPSVVRRLIGTSLGELAHPDTVSTAQLLMTELLTNALKACGPLTPVIVVVCAAEGYVELNVHDPDADRLPISSTEMPEGLAESGRGLPIIEALGQGPVHIRATDLGKKVTCRIPDTAA